MEMERPKQEVAEAPAFATPAPQLSSVEDLERKLALIGKAELPAKPAAEVKPPAPVPAPAAVPAAAKVQGGKNALLVSYCYIVLTSYGEATKMKVARDSLYRFFASPGPHHGRQGKSESATGKSTGNKATSAR